MHQTRFLNLTFKNQITLRIRIGNINKNTYSDSSTTIWEVDQTLKLLLKLSKLKRLKNKS